MTAALRVRAVIALLAKYVRVGYLWDLMARTTQKRPSAPALQPRAALRLLRSVVQSGQPLAANSQLEHYEYTAWHSTAQHALAQAFGENTPIVEDFARLLEYSYRPIDNAQALADRRQAMNNALKALAGHINILEAQAEPEPEPEPEPMPVRPAQAGRMVFIGHGGSNVWRDLRDLLRERLHLAVDEFNRMPPAGMTTVERLEDMLNSARFAFLVMTAEDENSSGGKARARQNVVHEVGLFQGRLGFRKAIVLLEEGCEEFSNITGLSQIRFPKSDISSKFEEIRRVLEREGLIPGTGRAF